MSPGLQLVLLVVLVVLVLGWMWLVIHLLVSINGLLENLWAYVIAKEDDDEDQ